jgi:hypothetical protein
MGVAASWHRQAAAPHRWIGYVGLADRALRGLHMIWEGHRTMVVDLGHADAYNSGPRSSRPGWDRPLSAPAMVLPAIRP